MSVVQQCSRRPCPLPSRAGCESLDEPPTRRRIGRRNLFGNKGAGLEKGSEAGMHNSRFSLYRDKHVDGILWGHPALDTLKLFSVFLTPASAVHVYSKAHSNPELHSMSHAALLNYSTLASSAPSYDWIAVVCLVIGLYFIETAASKFVPGCCGIAGSCSSLRLSCEFAGQCPRHASLHVQVNCNRPFNSTGCFCSSDCPHMQREGPPS